MPKQIVLLSGRVASGKSTLAKKLESRFGAIILHTKDLILTLKPKTPHERQALQKAGERLDKDTKGRWVADALVMALTSQPEGVIAVVDAVRIKNQIDAIRKAYGATVSHIHLTAPEGALAMRYSSRDAKGVSELPKYKDVVKDRTERNVEKLSATADIEVNTEECNGEDVFVRAASYLGYYERGNQRVVDVLVGGQYGSEGKGHIASYLAPEYDVLVRVGGPNAGHTVYEQTENAKFFHLPSGSARNESAAIVLGPGSVIDVELLMQEVMLHKIEGRLTIDPQAIVIRKSDKTRERKLAEIMGSTGKGVGSATSRKILEGRINDKTILAKYAKRLNPYIRECREVLEDAYTSGKKVFLEGTQGTGLSLHHGSYPYVTSRDTTAGGAISEAGIAPSKVRRIVLVCRTFPIRVGNPPRGTSGDLQHEISYEELSRRSGIELNELLETEKTTRTNRQRRIGMFEWDLFRKAVSLNGPSDIALTFTDYISCENRNARRFEQLTGPTLRFIHELEHVSACPVSLISYRFDYRSIINRRTWR